MNEQGWVKLDRKIFEWEWYDDINTRCFFIHCILRANHQSKKWKGITINRGQFISSLEKLSIETKLSISQIRTCLKKLKLTGEMTYKTNSQHTVFTVESYDGYQSNDKPNDKPVTNESQTNDKPVTTNKNEKNYKNEITKINQSAQALIPYQDIVDAYHLHAPLLSRVTKLTDKRKRTLSKFLKTDKRYQSIEFWNDYFFKVNSLPFYNGTQNGSNWRATFDWVIREDNMIKIQEVPDNATI